MEGADDESAELLSRPSDFLFYFFVTNEPFYELRKSFQKS